MTEGALHFQSSGEGEPLLLIHGLFGSLENLGALSRALSSRFAVFAIDLPNHGRSPHTSSMRLAALAQAVFAWVQSQGLQNIRIIGHSLGGKVAMELALLYPDLVNELVVLDIAPVQYTAHHNAVFQGLLALEPKNIRSRREADAQLAEYVEVPSVRHFLLKNLQRAEDGGYYWRMNLPVLHSDYQSVLAANSEGRFAGPVLFVKGANSDYLQEKYRPAIQKRFPAARLEVIADTGHWLHAEKPQQVIAAVSGFLV